ncbi:AAA family ATPase [Allokutzneria sp. A3M-2-11 16]|uniref:ATP-binding protein n=1 Tax=Allokutzneria sp. A3M-2-11 16 TaxID=2962043 RepID=UPI0020B8493A|nr:AAA family ATPase [Allokutzneria sp. A3M-2-11 16]MCP3802605.1 AAA family ATPase [Allokutzneria sp. A3M-2-11 16]
MRELIGRDRPRAVLLNELRKADSGRGGACFVVGEAGIGKTALVSTVVGSARAAGAAVVIGACWEGEEAPGYWPWLQVVRELRPGQRFDSAGFEFYDAVTRLLVAAARERPLVVLLEDLHWADTASLRLLDFVVQHARHERLLVLGTSRRNLTQQATTVALSGLDRDGVGAMIEQITGGKPESGLTDEIHRCTGGNPFFVEQAVHLWQGGSPLAPSVRARLSRHSNDVVALLRTAAALGPRFHRNLLAALSGHSVDQVLGQAGNLVEAVGDGWFAFAHDLIREELRTEPEKTSAAVILALKENPALADYLLPAERAHHAHIAGDQAIEHFVIAAEDAVSRLARDEAVRHYQRALDRTPLAEPRKRALIALGLGVSQHWAGDPGAARSFEVARSIARELDDPRLLARIALDLHFNHGPDELRRAHAELGLGDPQGTDDEIARAVSRQAADLARQHGDDEELRFSLHACIASTWGIGTAAERIAITEELIPLARRAGDRELELHAMSWRVGALLENGDPRYRAEHHRYVEEAESTGLALFRHDALLNRAMLATLSGDYDEARECADRAREIGEQPHLDREDVWLLQRWAIELRAGRADEVDALLDRMRDRGTQFFPLLRGIVAAQRGEAVVLPDEEFPRWIAALGLWLQVEAAVASGDPLQRERVRAALLPYSGQWAVAATVVVAGPVDLWLGMLGDQDRLAAAHAQAEALGARLRSGNVFRLVDEVWTLTFAGRSVQVPASLGLRDLHALLSNPGKDIAASWLLNPEAPAAFGSDGVLDSEAKARYRRRLDELETAIEEQPDDGKAARLDEERQALLEELRAAAGLGGRTRRLGDTAERARKAVGNRVRDALRRLDDRHPALAEYLRETVTTGTTCRYEPSTGITWRL